MCTMMQNLGGCCPMAPFELEEGRLLTLEFHRLLLCVVSFCYRDLSHSCRSGPNFGHRYIVSYMYVNRVRDNNMFCYGHDKKGETKLTRYSKMIKIEYLLDYF